ncbi:macrosialin-like [Cheilinus undulatus]|uniref:macrosialin-like n=1 Tax=Cheilinus undulatus TaxID=241271 RepID=UPI001BD67851|nr:macrosialin-like [Cheilinus undulatus]
MKRTAGIVFLALCALTALSLAEDEERFHPSGSVDPPRAGFGQSGTTGKPEPTSPPKSTETPAPKPPKSTPAPTTQHPKPAPTTKPPKTSPAQTTQSPKPTPAKTTQSPTPTPAKTTQSPKPTPAKTTQSPKPTPAKTTQSPKPTPAKTTQSSNTTATPKPPKTTQHSQTTKVPTTAPPTTNTSKTTPVPTKPPVTTAKPTTTPPSPSPTPSANLTGGNYTLMDKTNICLMAQMELQIRLVSPKGNGTFIVQPKSTKVEGECKDPKANLTLTFKEGFITFLFNKSSDNNTVYVHTLSFKLLYPMNKEENKFSGSNSSLRIFSAKVGHSYSCKKETLYMGKGLYLDVDKDRMQAFNLTKSNEFGLPDPCEADQPDYRVAVAVGVTLLVLIVIVVLAYLLGRRRRTDGYQTL